MNPQTRYLATGAFVLVGVLVLVVLVLWLGRQGDQRVLARYAVLIDSEVNGLSPGSAVRYLGVNSGQVDTITLRAQPDMHVEVIIELDAGIPVGQQSYATLVTQGITGIVNVDLGVDPGQDAELTTTESGLRIIPFRVTGIAAVIASSDTITRDLSDLLVQLRELTGHGNRERVTKILDDLNRVSSALASHENDLPAIVADVRALAASARASAEGLNAVIEDDLPKISSDLRLASERLAIVSARVDGWLTRNDAAIETLLQDGAGQLPALIRELRDASSEVARLARYLREEPSRVVYKPRRDEVKADP